MEFPGKRTQAKYVKSRGSLQVLKFNPNFFNLPAILMRNFFLEKKFKTICQKKIPKKICSLRIAANMKDCATCEQPPGTYRDWAYFPDIQFLRFLSETRPIPT